MLFLLFWCAWTPLFFTLSKSLIHPYILPSCIPAALIISFYWTSLRSKKLYASIAIGLPILLFIVHISGAAKSFYNHTTDKYLISNLDKVKKMYVLDSKSYSSQFYTQGKIQLIKINQLKNVLVSQKPFYIIISNNRFKLLNYSIKKKLRKIDSNKKTGIYEFDPSIKN
tara:strand:- start:599 stop:1105 length:507 start_codon:yes stop_codon:yes gene_type:complete